MASSLHRPHLPRGPRFGAVLALVSATAFATLAVLGRWALDAGLGTETLLQWRFGVAGLVLAAGGMLRAPALGRRRVLLFISGLIYTAQTSFYFGSLERITAGTTALLLYLAPVFVVVYSRMMGRRPTRPQVVSVALGLAGLAVIAGLPSAADADVVGLLLGAAAGATFAGYILAGELVFAGVPARVIAAHTMLGAAIGFVMLDLAGGGGMSLPRGSNQWLIVAATVVVPTLVAIPLLFEAVARIGAGPTAVISNAEPVATIVFGAMFLDEPVRAVQIVGGAFILLAAFLAQRSVRLALVGSDATSAGSV